MAEEQPRRCEPGHPFCANNCGFFGNPATLNLCSKCYHASAYAAAASTSSSMPKADGGEDASGALTINPPTQPAEVEEEGEKKAMAAAVAAAAGAGRCASCRKRVGLVWFECRCGSTFCGAHRHAERHACTYDFKVAGRDAIARANPLVKADKLRYKI